MRRLKIFTSFMAAALLIASCGGPQKMADKASLVKYKVTPDPIETHGGKVAVSVDVNYPEKYFHKKAVVTATPFLKYEGGETEMKSETLQGEAVEDNYKVISYASGGSLKYSDEIDYTDAMMRSELFVKGTAVVGKKTVELPAIKIADGIVTTPLLVDKKGKAIAFGDKFKRIVPDEYVADILYVINRYDVRDSELKKKEVTGMKDFLVKANSDKRVNLKGIEVSAYASPDGALDLNTKLAGNREGSASRYLKNSLQRSKIDVPKDDDFFKLLSTPEDWEGFKKLMEQSTIQDKDLILRVLSMYSDPVVREKEIKNISEAFEVIKKDILPKLRRSKLTVNVEKIGWSDDEIKGFVAGDISKLGLEELLYAASLYTDNKTKLKVYEKAASSFPDCIRAHNNVGVVKYAMGDVSGAKSAFNKAKAIKDHNIVKNNLGVIALAEGDVAAAGDLFTSAMGAGDEVNYNMGIIKIMQGDYEAASTYYGSTKSVNSALTMLLNGNPGPCVETLKMVDEETAKKYYLMAVAAARDSDVEIMFNSLRTAVAMDASWKAYAKKDIEFSKYFEEGLFKEITQ